MSDAVIRALGGDDDSPGIAPATIERRLSTFSNNTKSVVESYFARTLNYPLPEASIELSELADTVDQWLAAEMPELSPIARRKLASYYTYQWR